MGFADLPGRVGGVLQGTAGLYLRASMIQVHDMHMAIAPAHRSLVDRVYALLSEKNSK
jgi:hypothetical protein